MEQYRLKDQTVQRLIQTALQETWNPFLDLSWNTPVDKDALMANSRSLLENLPEFRKMSVVQQKEFKLKESVYHICNLLAGEHKGVQLAAQILLGCSQEESADWPFFASTILSDERNHVLALNEYLNRKIGLVYEPHPRIDRVLNSLLADGSFEIKLFIGQVVLEWTATSLLSSLVSKKTEPLFHDILRRILRDEGRHLMFNRLVFSHLGADRFDTKRREIEDLLFESIVACVSSLCAIPVWVEFGLSQDSCKTYALQEMEDRGVIRFYRDVLPKELNRCHFYSDRLNSLLKDELPKKIIEDHRSYHPELKLIA